MFGRAVTCGRFADKDELLKRQVQRDLQALSEIDEQLGGGEGYAWRNPEEGNESTCNGYPKDPCMVYLPTFG